MAQRSVLSGTRALASVGPRTACARSVTTPSAAATASWSRRHFASSSCDRAPWGDRGTPHQEAGEAAGRSWASSSRSLPWASNAQEAESLDSPSRTIFRTSRSSPSSSSSLSESDSPSSASADSTPRLKPPKLTREEFERQHPNWKKEKPRVRGTFDGGLEARLGKEKFLQILREEKAEARAKEKAERYAKKAGGAAEEGSEEGAEEDVDPAERPPLILHMNSLPSTLSAEQLFFDVVKSGLDVLTCELLNDGDRCTGIVELASDRDLKSCLKALTTDDGTYKRRIEITGHPGTVSEHFTPSKSRLAVSNIPLLCTLPSLASAFTRASIPLQAIQLVRAPPAKGGGRPPSQDAPTASPVPHTGLAFIHVREDHLEKALRAKITIGKGARLHIGVARHEPPPAISNKPDFVNGPAVMVKYGG